VHFDQLPSNNIKEETIKICSFMHYVISDGHRGRNRALKLVTRKWRSRGWWFPPKLNDAPLPPSTVFTAWTVFQPDSLSPGACVAAKIELNCLQSRMLLRFFLPKNSWKSTTECLSVVIHQSTGPTSLRVMGLNCCSSALSAHFTNLQIPSNPRDITFANWSVQTGYRKIL
jgi:hypothetical protein